MSKRGMQDTSFIVLKTTAIARAILKNAYGGVAPTSYKIVSLPARRVLSV
jgi:hypothetical protein